MTKKNFKIIFTIIIVLAIIVRIIYIVKNPYTEYQHDIGSIEGDGGLNYIFQIYQNWQLPQDNEYQHYHPPFHQIVSAIYLRVLDNFIGDNPRKLCESLQWLTAIYSIALIFIVYKILKELKIKDKFKILVLLVVAFHPTMIILSGSINNDNLCLMLTIWGILRLIKWYKNSNIENTFFLAIITGLSVMTKTTGAIIAIPISYIFILKFYKELRKTSNKMQVIKKFISTFLIFGLIALPIGLWYPIRNYILFNQPILYVLDPEDMSQYLGNYSYLQRIFSGGDTLLNMYINSKNYNMLIYTLKCSLFGQFSWGTDLLTQILYFVALGVNFILIVLTVVFLIKLLKIKSKRNLVWKIAFVLLFAFNIISYIIMNIKLPYTCSMNFRYLAIILFLCSMFIAFVLEDKSRYNKEVSNIMYNSVLILTLILFVTSDTIIVL